MSSNDSDQHIKFFLNSALYIPINENGELQCLCAEGALGFVLQLHTMDEKATRALKIPKVTGATHQENAYICSLMQAELEAVRKIDGMHGLAQELVPAEEHLTNGFLRRKIQSETASHREKDLAKSYDGAIILFNFKKGSNPRVCAIKKVESKEVEKSKTSGCEIEVRPSTMEDPPEISEEMFDKIAKEFSGKAIFIEKSVGTQKRNETRLFLENEALNNSVIGQMWYAGLPSVAYAWMPGTLQKAISRAEAKNWTIKDHLHLIKRVVKAVEALHEEGMLHGDLRAANIAYRKDPRNPDNYFVSDYGSFYRQHPMSVEDTDTTGETQYAIHGGTERRSVFYSPERRSGHEHETLDVAIIVPPQADTGLLSIAVGWREDLIEKIDGKNSGIKQRILDEIYDLQKHQTNAVQSTQHHNELLKGDSIQIRDYVFEVEKFQSVTIDPSKDKKNKPTTTKIDSIDKKDKSMTIKSDSIDEFTDEKVNFKYFQCSTDHWQIFQGHIQVRNDDNPFSNPTWFPIPSFIEVRQWSVATDIYSIGALLLYSVFCQSKNLVNDEDSSGKEESRIEEDFRVMISYLEDIQYFNSIWKDLAPLRDVIVNVSESVRDFETKAYYNPLTGIREEIKKGRDKTESSKGSPNFKTIEGKSIEVTNRLTASIPGIKEIVNAFTTKVKNEEGENEDLIYLGRFIIFIHFILCCLHRQKHIDSDQMNIDNPDSKLKEKAAKNILKYDKNIFCESRTSSASAESIKEVLKSLSEIQEYFNSTRVDFTVRLDKISSFDLRSEPELRESFEKVKKYSQDKDSELEALKRNCENTLQRHLDILNKNRGKLDKIVEEKTTKKRNIEKNRAKKILRVMEIKGLSAEIKSVQKDIDSIKENISMVKEALRCVDEETKSTQIY